MSTLEPDYEAILRRSLHAAAESVEPAGDGLQQIRARLRKPRPFVLAWLLADSELARPVFSGLESAADWYLQVLRRSGQALRPVAERFGLAGAGDGRGLGRLAWVRPAAAMAMAIFVVAAGVFAALELPQAISRTGALQLPFFQTSSSPGGSGRPRVNGSATPLPGVVPNGSPGPGSGRAGSSASCSPSPGSKTRAPSSSPSAPPSSTPSSTPSQSPSPSTSPSPTPTPSTTPSATPTPSGTSTPGTGATSTPAAAETAQVISASPSAAVPGSQVPLPYPSAAPTPCRSGSAKPQPHVAAARSAAGIPSGSLALGGNAVVARES